MTEIISAKELQAIIGKDKISIIDANWFLPTENKSGHGEFLKKHIHGAVFFDIDACCASDSQLPHSLPSANIFAETMQKLGISNDDKIIVYDRIGYFSAPRLYWMLRHFGHGDIAILDGGLQAWEAAGLPVESGQVSPVAGNFTAKAAGNMTVQKNDVLQSIGSDATIIDARSSARFDGTAPEPRAGLRSGHIPGSANVPYDECFDKTTGLFKSPEELQEIFQSKISNDKAQEIICSCGSGITACVAIFALQKLGYSNVKLYDGSWSEWGADATLPIESS